MMVTVLSQCSVALLSVRFEPVSALVKSQPSLVPRDGTFLNGALRQQLLTRGKIMAALRGSGVADMSGAAAVILENDGNLGVIKV